MVDGEYALPTPPRGPPLVDEEHTWVIHGRAYDLRAFAARHPGGAYALSLGAGRDCTAMFESYHALSGDAPAKLLAKYEVHDRHKVIDKLKLYKWKEEDPFYAELKSEVRATLKANGITSHKASNVRWAFFWFGFLSQLVPLYYFLQGSWVALFVLPLWLWVFSVNYFHDASHFALSKSSTVNRIVTHLFPYFESPTTWAHQHIIGHHAYTNDDDQDPDVMDRLKSRKKIWRWSYLYWPLFTFMGCFIFDAAFFYYTLKYKQKVPMAKSVKNAMRYVAHMFGRLLVAYGMFVVPFQLFEPAKAFMFATVPLGVFGTCFGALTQLSHMTPDTYGNRNKSKSSWAAHEVLTTQNISTNSTFWFIFSGALNLQIEHHLFPGMCSEHFPLIVPVVKKVCAKHGIAYQESANYLEGFRLHRRLLDSTCTEGGFWG